jgi:hypothetical protein
MDVETTHLIAVVIRIALPREAQVPLAVGGAAILAIAAYLWLFRNQRTGSRWWLGTLLAAASAFALLLAFNSVTPRPAFYGWTLVMTATSVGSMWCLASTGWPLYARLVGGLAAVASAGRLIAEPLYIVRAAPVAAGEPRAYFAPLHHPANLVAITMIVILVAVVLTLPGRRKQPDPWAIPA